MAMNKTGNPDARVNPKGRLNMEAGADLKR